MGSLAPWLANWGYRNGLIRGLLDQTLGIDRQRTMPPLAARTFQHWFKQRPASASAPRSQGPVILWDDTYLSYNEPEIGQAAVRVLEAAGSVVGSAVSVALAIGSGVGVALLVRAQASWAAPARRTTTKSQAINRVRWDMRVTPNINH